MIEAQATDRPVRRLSSRVAALGRVPRRLLASVRRRRESEAFLQSIIDNIPMIVTVKDAETRRYVQINRLGLDAIDRTAEQVIGLQRSDLVPGDLSSGLDDFDRRAIEQGEPVDAGAVTVETPDGPKVLGIRKVPILDADGAARHLLTITEDITDRQQTVAELEAARADAERANAAKSEFLSRMSHELRTPLNAVLGFGQLLEFEELTEAQRASVEQILRGGRHLLGLINEVLDISRIETGNLSLSLEPVALEHVIEETLELVRPIADDAHLRLPRGPMPDWQVWVRADQQRLRQVLLNLLSNAVKYNEPGGSISIRCSELRGRQVRISVTDTGRGIAEEDVDKLFSPFERLGADETEIQGTGLGLTLSKRLVEAMHGTIGVDSVPGVGSTFWIQLGSCETSELMSTSSGVAVTGERTAGVPRILHVEDSLSSLRWVESLLSDHDLELISVADAETALDMAIRFRPDLVLLDLEVAGTDPAELVADLRQHELTSRTSIVTIGPADRAIEGVERHLGRPVTDAALIAEVFDAVAVAAAMRPT